MPFFDDNLIGGYEMGSLKSNGLYYLTRQMETIAKIYFTKDQRAMNKMLKDVDSVDTRFRFNQRVKNAYRQLDPIEQLFINNEYFYENYPGWWKDLFDKNKYKKLKKQSLYHFLKLFYEEE